MPVLKQIWFIFICIFDAPTDFRSVVDGAEYELGRPIVARADVRHIWLAGQQLFGAAEIAQFQDSSLGIQQQVLRFNVSVTYAHLMNIS